MNDHTIIAWIEQIVPRLRDSHWSPALEINGVDILESLRSPLYNALLNLSRRQTNQSVVTTSRLKIPGFIREGRCPLFIQSWLDEQQGKRISGDPYQTQIIFWPREPTHVKAQIPVAEALGQLGVSYQFVACRPRIVDSLQTLGFQTVFTRAAWPRLVTETRQETKHLLRCLAGDPEIKLHGFPAPVTSERIFNTIRQMLWDLAPLVTETAAVATALIEQFAPDVFVVGNDITLEGRSCCFVANKFGIPTVSLMHGMVAGALHHYHIVDKMLVYGLKDKRYLMACGMSNSRVVVTGAPYLDSLPQQRGDIHPNIQVKLNIASNQPMILVATSGPGNSISHKHHLATIENIMRLSSRLTDVLLVARLHRKDRLIYYEQIQRRIPESRLVIIPNGEPGFPSDIFDWLQGCALVLTGASTVAVEAMLMGVPVISMDFADELRQIDFIDAQAVLKAMSLDELEMMIQRVLNNPSQIANTLARMRTYIADAFYAMDGKSSLRCAHEIKELIAQYYV
jgi:predicted glycosyltransferase